MGVNGLWKLISAHSQRHSLQAYCAKMVAEAHPNSSLYRYVRIGIDMSTMICECESAAAAMERHGYFEGGAIYILFTKLAILLASPATFIFVLDGPERPKLKRHRHVISGRQEKWIPAALELIAAFGYHVHQAPGEAEAELAMLNKCGAIDGIMTSDSDVFVFGAKTVFRTVQNAAKEIEDDTDVLLSSTLFDALDFTVNELVFFALLTGGDYDTTGIPGCGPVTARALARCGFAQQLADIYQLLASGSDLAFQSSLADWRSSIQKELLTNSQGHLVRRDPSTASSIPANFPNLEIINLYFNPIVSPPSHVNNLTWLHQQPSLSRLQQICASRFLWNTEEVAVKRFANLIFKGVLFQAFYSPLAEYSTSNSRLYLPDLQINVASVSWRRRRGKYAKKLGDLPLPRIVCNTDTLINALSPAYTTTGQTLSISAPIHLLPLDVQHIFETLRTQKNPSKRSKRKNLSQEKSTAGDHRTNIIDLTSDDETPVFPSSKPASRHLGVLDLTDSENEQPVASSSRFEGSYIDLTLSD